MLQINFVNFAENVHTPALVVNCIFKNKLYVLLSVYLCCTVRDA